MEPYRVVPKGRQAALCLLQISLFQVMPILRMPLRAKVKLMGVRRVEVNRITAGTTAYLATEPGTTLQVVAMYRTPPIQEPAKTLSGFGWRSGSCSLFL